MRVPLRFLAVSLLLLVTACSSTLDMVEGVSRTVERVPADPTKTLTLLQAIDQYGPLPLERSLKLPPGTYTLEVEDAEYWYFHAPGLITVTVKEEMMRNRRFSVWSLPGGVMLAKRAGAYADAAYLDEPAGSKRMVLEFGPGFRGMEGTQWKREF